MVHSMADIPPVAYMYSMCIRRQAGEANVVLGGVVLGGACARNPIVQRVNVHGAVHVYNLTNCVWGSSSTL